MKNKFEMEYEAPTLLTPNYRYQIVRGSSCQTDMATIYDGSDICSSNVEVGTLA